MAAAFEGVTDVQALDDEQYMTLILLLRHLCIRHQIPRQFFGTARSEDSNTGFIKHPHPPNSV